jgi:hypothetical protein
MQQASRRQARIARHERATEADVGGFDRPDVDTDVDCELQRGIELFQPVLRRVEVQKLLQNLR